MRVMSKSVASTVERPGRQLTPAGTVAGAAAAQPRLRRNRRLAAPERQHRRRQQEGQRAAAATRVLDIPMLTNHLFGALRGADRFDPVDGGAAGAADGAGVGLTATTRRCRLFDDRLRPRDRFISDANSIRWSSSASASSGLRSASEIWPSLVASATRSPSSGSTASVTTVERCGSPSLALLLVVSGAGGQNQHVADDRRAIGSFTPWPSPRCRPSRPRRPACPARRSRRRRRPRSPGPRWRACPGG